MGAKERIKNDLAGIDMYLDSPEGKNETDRSAAEKIMAISQ
jgi:hypothetical protein